MKLNLKIKKLKICKMKIIGKQKFKNKLIYFLHLKL